MLLMESYKNLSKTTIKIRKLLEFHFSSQIFNNSQIYANSFSIKSTANYREAHLNLAAYKSKSKAKNM